MARKAQATEATQAVSTDIATGQQAIEATEAARAAWRAALYEECLEAVSAAAHEGKRVAHVMAPGEWLEGSDARARLHAAGFATEHVAGCLRVMW